MDDFDQYCKWSRKPSHFIEHYQARALGSYEVLDRAEDSDGYNPSENQTDDENSELCNDEIEEHFHEKDTGLHRIRSFKRTHKGVINQRDTDGKHSLLSLNLPTRSQSFTKGENPYRFGFNEKSPISSPDENPKNVINDHEDIKGTYEIHVLGKTGVGKTALCEQFISTETCELYSIDNSERLIRQVTVEIDGNEWNLIFKDSDDLDSYNEAEVNPDAFILVYSIDDKDSFNWCTEILQKKLESFSASAIFIVANKSDLERMRQISSEKGKRLASVYDAEFFEISAVLNHMVDNLLVQIIMKILRHKKKLRKAKDSKSKYSMKHKRSTPGNVFMDFFRRLSKAF